MDILLALSDAMQLVQRNFAVGRCNGIQKIQDVIKQQLACMRIVGISCESACENGTEMKVEPETVCLSEGVHPVQVVQRNVVALKVLAHVGAAATHAVTCDFSYHQFFPVLVVKKVIGKTPKSQNIAPALQK